MITRRQQRYALLSRKGFLKFEAEPLSEVPIKLVPYMKPLIRERLGLLRDAQRQKATTAQYEAQIKAYYNKHGFLKRNKAGKPVADVWAMVRDFEDRYTAKTPAYESPWLKKRRAMVDFMAMIERTIATQRRLRVRPA